MSGQLIQVTAAGNRRERHVCSGLCNARLKRQLRRTGLGGETPAVQPPAAAAGPPGTARSHGRSNSEFTGPGSPYLDRDAERAYLTQIIKDDDLVFAFLAHRFFRRE